MKKSRFTEQIVFALKQAELGTSVPDVCRKLGISDGLPHLSRHFLSSRRGLFKGLRTDAGPGCRTRQCNRRHLPGPDPGFYIFSELKVSVK